MTTKGSDGLLFFELLVTESRQEWLELVLVKVLYNSQKYQFPYVPLSPKWFLILEILQKSYSTSVLLVLFSSAAIYLMPHMLLIYCEVKFLNLT